jgi:glycosyltransferase involved in cell wall biosynthesis
MRRIRVSHIITRLIVGGAQENTILTCAGLNKNRFDVTLISGPQTGPEGELHSEARNAGIDPTIESTMVREVHPVKDAICLARLTNTLRSLKPDVVHTHSSKAGVLGRAAARMAGVPVIIHTVHGWGFHERTSAPARAIYVGLERQLARLTHSMVVVTNRDRDKGLAVGIGRPEQYRIIRSGVDLREFSRRAGDPARTRRELRIPESAPVVGTVGRLSPQKDPLTFIRMAARVVSLMPNTHFVMVGDGPLRQEVERLVQEHGLDGRVHLTGIRRDVPALLQMFDVFVLASLWEGLPRVIPQAMAASVPVVASEADGIAEIIRSGENGFMVRPGDDAALAERVVALMNDSPLAKRIVAAAHVTSAEYDVALMVQQLDALYTETMSSR